MHLTLPSLSELSLNTPYKSSSKLDIANLLSTPPLSPTSFEEHHHRTDVKIKRKRASPDQLQILNRVFSQTYFPSTELRRALGKELGMSPRTVQIWFQNKRQALRTRGRPHHQTATAAQELYCLPPISPPTSPTFDISFHQKVSLPPLRLSSNHLMQQSPSSLSLPSPIDYFHHRLF
ncbi:hypothetical protein G6F57_006576 [Rhizopus arrhizus]|uniref:Homeobox domain-containing protein n=1 Tax=Rhizopus oryzae TaxID=64495 RepID=A0A9P6X939_RHIOR|nr:hypothetical protein G6F24_006240 [Rhizopus arrhizus]KAG1423761.1 hypothetical protein G6F58_002682 [Rhizopus delemar]KAG0791760.1 hypothetical protein G6F21_004846 [Rhizopus arrhizus]KAG0815606.1 hypothetical protein G6F20_003851 [Rhizopus arrhizus]KAG0831859.1 hypothetical protein G6F18_007470 [Rhizopus arrhizus]